MGLCGSQYEKFRRYHCQWQWWWGYQIGAHGRYGKYRRLFGGGGGGLYTFYSIVLVLCICMLYVNSTAHFFYILIQFNHGTEPEVSISYDEEGNCYAYSTYDIPAGSPLRISYTGGDNSNPSYLFARYGFLEETSPGTFCKILVNYPSPELVNMGYDPTKMLFYKDTGGVSEEVWDVLLYQLLEKASKDNPDMEEVQQALYSAHMNGDYTTKQAIHEQYYPQTAAALLQHVNDFLQTLDDLSRKSAQRDPNKHPRLPLIRKHNDFVKQTFLKVRSQLQ